jgi:hypothetical protein
MNIFKNLKLRYEVFRGIKWKLHVIRLIRKHLVKLRSEYRLDNSSKNAARVETCMNEEEKYLAMFGRDVLILIGIYPLPGQCFQMMISG